MTSSRSRWFRLSMFGIALKIFISMLGDRVNLSGMGHRKPYMILGLILGALAFGAAGFVLPDQNLPLFAALMVGGSFSVALFDSTTDGLAIDITPREECGTVQGTMVGGRATAQAVLPDLTDNMGFAAVFWLLAGLNVLVAPILWALFRFAPEVARPTSDPAACALDP